MVKAVPHFFSEKECDVLIKAYKKMSWLITESTVTTDFEKIDPVIRRSKYIRFYKNYDYFFKRNYLQELYDKVTQLSINHYPYLIYENQYEDIKIIEYNKGDFFDWHYDCLGVGEERKLNFSIQLSDSDEYKGANLEFFKIRSFSEEDQQLSRRKGTIILYPSFLPHRITELTKGIRLCVVGHLNGTPFQ